NAVGIKRLLDVAHEPEVHFTHCDGHVGLLGYTDTVFTRQRSPKAYRQLEYLTDTLRNFCLPIFFADVLAKDVDVQISITQVTEANGIESIRFADLLDTRNQFGEVGARNDHVVRLREGIPVHGGCYVLAHLPEFFFLRAA